MSYLVFAEHEDGMWQQMLRVDETFDLDAWISKRVGLLKTLGIVGFHLIPCEEIMSSYYTNDDEYEIVYVGYEAPLDIPFPELMREYDHVAHNEITKQVAGRHVVATLREEREQDGMLSVRIMKKVRRTNED